MEITYDEQADALYIEFKRSAFAKNRKLDDLTIVDLDKQGKIIGMEILKASERLPADSLTQITRQNGIKAHA